MPDKEQISVDIRPWSNQDLELLMQLLGDPAMMRHLGGPETPEKISARHQRYCQNSASGADPMFAIVVGHERVAAGSIGFWQKDWQGHFVWETGWSVLPAFQGQGIATRAIAAIVERACVEAKHRYMHAFPSVDNAPSNAICRKGGFTLQTAVDFEYPPGQIMRCNDWRLDLFAAVAARP